MARKLYEKQAIRRRTGALANGVVLVVYTDAAGTVPADISTSSGGSAIAGSVVTTADIAGLGPAALRFYGPTDGTDILYMRVPSDTSLGVQKIEADTDPRLDALEAGVGGGGIAATVFDAKGDLIAASAADTAARLAVGADGYGLVSDSAATTGLKWLSTPNYNVKAPPYNAVADGVADDTAEIQAAIDAADAARGGIVSLPPGAYKVTTLTMKSGVSLVGVGTQHSFPQDGPTALIGTAGSDILAMPTATHNVSIQHLALRQGRRGISSTSVASTQIYIDHVTFSGQSDAAVFVEGAIERWRFRNCYFSGGDYGYRHDNVLVTGANYIDKVDFIDCIWDGQAVNAVKIAVVTSNTVTFLNPIFNTTRQHGVVLDGGIRGLTFINANTEGVGQDGTANPTTLSGSVTAGATSGTLASSTGWAASGSSVTIQGAAADGNDHSGGAWTRSGTTVTWTTATVTTISGPRITDAIYDDFHLANSVAAPGEITFLGGLIGGQGTGGHLRYAINNSVGATIYTYGTGTSSLPIYDPSMRVMGVGVNTVVRQPTSGTWTNKSLRGLAAFSPTGTENTRNWLASPAGRPLTLFLNDSNLAGTGTWDKLEVRVFDANRTRVFNVDGTTFDVVQERSTAQLTVKGALDHDGTTVGFYGTAPAVKPTVTGSRASNPAVAALLTDLASLGLLTDSTTAGTAADLGAVTVVGGGKETVQAHGAMSTTETFDLANGNIHSGTLDANCTFTFSGTTASVGCSLTLILLQSGAGSFTATWPASVKWPAGTAPVLSTTAGKVDVFSFVTVDNGTTWYGFTSGLDLR